MPYTMDDNFTTFERLVIAASLLDIEDNSCVRWSPRLANENPHVRIQKEEEGCFASVGPRADGVLNLGEGCFVSNVKKILRIIASQ